MDFHVKKLMNKNPDLQQNCTACCRSFLNPGFERAQTCACLAFFD